MSEAIEICGVRVTSPGKVLFPARGFTKLDLARYYIAVAEGALRGSGGRPNVLVRYPNGVGEEFFYQKRAPAKRPACPSSPTASMAPSPATPWSGFQPGVVIA